jgi:hypothetical protein
MKKLAAIVIAGLSALLQVGCSTMQVETDHDPDFDFTPLKTYAWMSGSDKTADDPKEPRSLVGDRIRAAIEKDLGAKGYRRVESQMADFLVAFRVGMRDVAEVDPMDDFYEASGGVGWWTGERRTFYQFTEGSLEIDLINPKAKKLIWRGIARCEISKNVDPEEREKRVNKAVGRLLEGFPPKKGD